MTTLSSQRGLRWGALLLLALLSGLPAHARVHHSEAWARDRFAAAERMREALNGRPPADRTRHSYQRVVNAYRSVYFGAPTSTKADPSVVAVAEILVEMGRCFDDEKILNGAITEYRFLRREYPGSKYRFDALFTIGEVYKDDLDDADEARAAFQEFLHRYPHHRLAEDAQQAILELDKQAEAEKKAAKAASAAAARKDQSAKDATGAEAEARPPAPRAADHSASLPRVTGIRHWSTPDYTRVAIDLESEVKFGSQRIANPDRIFFDLRGTKLASTLVGKSFDVDDGFLKKVRVAQFQPGRTRVVLEVDDLSDYNAFLLPNPYRLIIDIHGKKARNNTPKDSEAGGAADLEAAPKAGAKVDLEAGVKAAPKKSPVDSSAGHTASSKTAVVKKVVEADDDEEDASRNQVAKQDPAEGNPAPASPVSTSARKPVGSASDNDNDEADEKARDVSAKAGQRKPAARTAGRKSGPTMEDAREARPTASGDRSLIRALGLKIGKIVIDPGHGGHDTGTIGPNGLEEKDLVLEVGRRLGKLLEARLGAEVVYTRKDDTFIPLETRTAIANRERADLFISIHANSSHDPAARGVETYYLNFTSSPEALEVAARENAVSEKSIYELQDLVKKIALKEKIEESREFASDVQESLHSGLAAKSPAIRNRGVKKAPFIVLIGANMPSILAEISFVSNPTDEHRLETSEHRQRIAESLYRGIARYVNGLSGVKVASKLDKAAGQ